MLFSPYSQMIQIMVQKLFQLPVQGVSPPPLNVVSPNGSEVWQAGTIQTIQWKYTGNIGTYVKIELLKNGRFNRTITSYASKGSNGIGTYRWTIPFSQRPWELIIR